MPPTVLIVDDDADVLHAAQLALAGASIKALTARSPAAVGDLLASHRIDALLFDLNYQRGATRGDEGLRWLEEVKRRDPELAIIVITAHSDINIAVDAMKRGATDFIAKPWDNARMLTTVQNAIALCNTRRTAAALQQTAQELAREPANEVIMMGESAAMQHVRSLIARAAPTDANVLVLGENGTGKELVARALHRASARAAAPLVSVDLGAIAPTLFESELFGHKKGAFTDAHTDRLGRFQAANGGTLFLDELGNLPLALQPKLLSVLEQRSVRAVGSDTEAAIDVRLISATNLSRDALADDRQFRPDLLFRLNTVEIHLPPLRQRRDDIPLLAAHFLQQYAKKYAKPKRTISNDAMAALARYDWPGNVRALRHAIERAVILGANDTLETNDFALPESAPQATASNAVNEDLNLDRLERETIDRALKRNNYNISLAAKDLGLTRASLYRRMERHDL